MEDYTELKNALESQTINNLFSQFNSLTFDEIKYITDVNTMNSVQKIFEYAIKYKKWVELKTEKEKNGHLNDLYESMLTYAHKLLNQRIYIDLCDFTIDKELDSMDNNSGVDWNDKVKTFDNIKHRRKYFFGTWMQLFEKQDSVKDDILCKLMNHCDPKTSCIKYTLEFNLKNIDIIRKNVILSVLKMSSYCKDEMNKIQTHRLNVTETNYKSKPQHTPEGWKLIMSVEINAFPYIINMTDSEYHFLEYTSNETNEEGIVTRVVKELYPNGWIDSMKIK